MAELWSDVQVFLPQEDDRPGLRLFRLPVHLLPVLPGVLHMRVRLFVCVVEFINGGDAERQIEAVWEAFGTVWHQM